MFIPDSLIFPWKKKIFDSLHREHAAITENDVILVCGVLTVMWEDKPTGLTVFTVIKILAHTM